MASGICKLTGQRGKFVKAHVIPKALTKPGTKGMPFAQAGRGVAPVKRWDSWYDPALVTQAGEDLLTAYDTWAVEELRKHKLIWTAWGPMQSLAVEGFQVLNGVYGLRSINGIDTWRLRCFLLSVLWRAAVSNMHEFEEVVLTKGELGQLRSMVAKGTAEPLNFFPIQLTQLSTLGAVHNLTPLAQERPLSILDLEGTKVPIFRFYFDGLIVHIHRNLPRQHYERMGELLLGTNPNGVKLPTVTFEASWQRENLAELITEAFVEWPERMGRIPGF